jgi:hypothetical protein
MPMRTLLVTAAAATLATLPLAVSTTTASAAAGETPTYQALPLSYSHAEPADSSGNVPARVVNGANSVNVTFRLAQLPIKKGGPKVNTLVVRHRVGNVFSPKMADLDFQVSALAMRLDPAKPDYAQFIVDTQSPTRVEILTGPFSSAPACGARAVVNRDKDTITTILPVRRCLGTAKSPDVMVESFISLDRGNDVHNIRNAGEFFYSVGAMSFRP